MYNSQPWVFRLCDGAIEVLADPARQLNVADSRGWARRLACGAATFNARLALAWAGTPADVDLLRDDAQPELIARLVPAGRRPPTYAERDLYAAIERRASTREPFWPDAVPPAVRARLVEAAQAEGCRLELLVGMTALLGFSHIAHSADRVLRRSEVYQAELMTWTATEPVAEVTTPDELVPQRSFARRNGPAGAVYEPEPLIAVLGTRSDSRSDQVMAGQALQRVLLTATDEGLTSSMISQPVEVPAARDQLRRSLARRAFPQIALRLGYGLAGRPAVRRDVTEVLAG